MSRKLVTLVYERKIGSMLKKAVLAAMADRANDDGTGVWTSKVRLADEIEASRRGVINAIQELVRDGILIDRGLRAAGSTHEYDIAVSVVTALPRSRADTRGCENVHTPEQDANPAQICTGGVNRVHGGCAPSSHKPSLNRPLTTVAKATVSGTVDHVEQITGKSRKPRPPKAAPELQPALEAYNRLAARLKAERGGKTVWPVVTTFTAKRQAALKARIAEHGIEAWGTVLRKAYASPFCTGAKNGWTADFEFLTSPSGFLKTLEGNYDDRTHHARGASGHSASNGGRPDAFDRLADRLQGGAAGSDPRQHDDAGAADGYVIEAGPARIGG
jgi:DNA-binding Lrp family transcriptional regulator